VAIELLGAGINFYETPTGQLPIEMQRLGEAHLRGTDGNTSCFGISF
jgi:hypothetical protein